MKNAMNMLSMSAKDSGELELKLRGNYYSLVNLFADWRRMPFASRITSLRITRDSIEPDNLVDADITLEAWIEK